MSRLTSSFERLSRREKVLVGFMVVLLLCTVVFIFHVVVGSRVSDLEETLQEDRTALQQIYARSTKYLEARASTERIQQVASNNKDLNLKLRINELAKKINFQARDRRGNVTSSKRLSDVMQFEQTKETYLSKKRMRRSTRVRNESKEGFYRKEQEVTLGQSVEFDALYRLMEAIETSSHMLFVTDISVKREFNDGDYAQRNASFTVTTYYYRGEDEEE